MYREVYVVVVGLHWAWAHYGVGNLTNAKHANTLPTQGVRGGGGVE